jgi:hypothetical protein
LLEDNREVSGNVRLRQVWGVNPPLTACLLTDKLIALNSDLDGAHYNHSTTADWWFEEAEESE